MESQMAMDLGLSVEAMVVQSRSSNNHLVWKCESHHPRSMGPRNGVKEHGTLLARGFYKAEPKRAPHTQGGDDVPESRNTAFDPISCDDGNLGAFVPKNDISQTYQSSGKNGRAQSIPF